MIGTISGNNEEGWLLVVWEPAKITEERVRPFQFKMKWKTETLDDAIAIAREMESHNALIGFQLIKPKDAIAA